MQENETILFFVSFNGSQGGFQLIFFHYSYTHGRSINSHQCIEVTIGYVVCKHTFRLVLQHILCGIRTSTTFRRWRKRRISFIVHPHCWAKNPHTCYEKKHMWLNVFLYSDLNITLMIRETKQNIPPAVRHSAIKHNKSHTMTLNTVRITRYCTIAEVHLPTSLNSFHYTDIPKSFETA